MPPFLAPLARPQLETLAFFLLGSTFVLALALYTVARRLRTLGQQLGEVQHQKQSLSTTYGRITEQWFPLLNQYPYDPQDFRFLGSPIDGVQFNEDSIVFVEFKANKSRLSEKQRRIKKLVEEGHVYWEEFHFTDDEE